jgi:hypothetical protein
MLFLELDPNEKGEAMVDIAKLKEEFPDDVDPDTEITDYTPDFVQPKEKQND